MFPWQRPRRASESGDNAACGAEAGVPRAAGPPPPPTTAAAAAAAAAHDNNGNNSNNGRSARSLGPQTSLSGGARGSAPPIQTSSASIDKHMARLGSLGAAGAKNAAAAAAAATAAARARALAAADVGGDTLLTAGRAGLKVGGAVGGAGFGCLARCGAGFSDFFLRSSIVDMAVGVVLGFSFQSLIEALVEAWLTPLLGAIFGATDWSALSFEVNGSKFQYGAFINSLLTFVLVVLSCYFFVVAPMERLMVMKNKKRYITKECVFCLADDVPLCATRCKYCCAELPELTPEEAALLATVNPLAAVGTAFDGVAGVIGPGGKIFGKIGSKKGKKGEAAAAAVAAATAMAATTEDQVALDVLGRESSDGGGGGDAPSPAGGEGRRRRRRRHLFGGGGGAAADHLTAHGLIAQEMAQASALRAMSNVAPPAGAGGSFSGSARSRPLACAGGSDDDNGGDGDGYARRAGVGGASGSDVEAFSRGGGFARSHASYDTATSGECGGRSLGGEIASEGGGGGGGGGAAAARAANRRRFF